MQSLNLTQSSSFKDVKLTECLTLLMSQVVLHVYPMDAIDEHLKQLISLRFPSYTKSENLEDLWEDLILMNYVLYFKQIIKQNKKSSAHISNFEYGVHVPNLELIQ